MLESVNAFGDGLQTEKKEWLPSGARIDYRILGPLEVRQAGERIDPSSHNQRVLLLDLLINRGRRISRERLIDDLWAEDPPATAPGVLQNYISALRRILGAETIETVGQGYTIRVERGAIDVDRFEDLVAAARTARDAGDAAAVGQHSAAALELWRGEPLSDVAYEPFARAAIAQLDALWGETIELKLESEILEGRARLAIPELEAAVHAHPLREHLWWLLMLALYRSGRQGDAVRTFQRARQASIDQLGLEPTVHLRDLERAILAQDPALDEVLPGVSRVVSRAQLPSNRVASSPVALVGRFAERAAVLAHLDGGWTGEGGGLCLLEGEPGIGKSRLLDEANLAALSAGSTVLAARSYETETGRPFGVWTDALRSVDLGALPEPLRIELTPLLPELGGERLDVDDPARLHDAVSAALTALTADATITILLDDLQWLDESSASLLHYVLRRVGTNPVAVVATARTAELKANSTASRLVEALRREDQLFEIVLGPLDAPSIAQLTVPIAPNADATMIAEACNGNPLFAIEMARGIALGGDALSSRLDALIGDRLSRLSAEASALVPWIAAFGRSVDPALLAEVINRPLGDLIEPLTEMEHNALLEVQADGGYDFSHDLVRTAAYKRQSTPRRAMLHTRIGVVLESAPDPDDTLAADAARHADAGGDSATCARACLRAARRCLRVGAHRDAESHALRGRTHARRLPYRQRIPIDLQLIHTLLHPALRLHDPGDLGAALTELCADAQRFDLRAELSSGLYLLARVNHWGWGDIPRARALMQRALDVLEVASGPDVEPILEGARCLAYLEIDMDRTTELFGQLAGLGDLATRSHQYQWGLGLVRAWSGDFDGARLALSQAITLAAVRDDHWAVFECSARLAVLDIDAGNIAAAEPVIAELAAAAVRLGAGGSEPTYASAIAALHRLADTSFPSDAFLAEIAALEAMDARFLVPDLLSSAAHLAYRNDRPHDAAAFARRAIDVAAEVDKPNEAARAHAVLACIAAARHERDTASRHVEAARAQVRSLRTDVEHLMREAERLGQTEPNAKETPWPSSSSKSDSIPPST